VLRQPDPAAAVLARAEPGVVGHLSNAAASGARSKPARSPAGCGAATCGASIPRRLCLSYFAKRRIASSARTPPVIAKAQTAPWRRLGARQHDLVDPGGELLHRCGEDEPGQTRTTGSRPSSKRRPPRKPGIHLSPSRDGASVSRLRRDTGNELVAISSRASRRPNRPSQFEVAALQPWHLFGEHRDACFTSRACG